MGRALSPAGFGRQYVPMRSIATKQGSSRYMIRGRVHTHVADLLDRTHR
jgi:hypothetical protein